jgi:nucleoside-diphosphate-sugar epimerase
MRKASPNGRLRVLILGGTGVFGSRLCRLLVADPTVVLTVAGRDRVRVDALAGELGISGLVFDWRRDLDRLLEERGYDALVHLAGPFQGQDYGVADLCIRHRGWLTDR